MNKQAIAMLFVVLFALSFVPPNTAVPSSRTLRPIFQTISNQHVLHDEFQIKGRMDIQIQDYAGTGANNHHDPSPPGGF